MAALVMSTQNHAYSSIILFLSGECRILAFPSFLFYANKRLLNHTIRTEQVKDLSLCELLCYYEPNCVSMNFKTTENAEGAFSCELNNSTHRRHDDEFMDNYGYLYREAEVGYFTLWEKSNQPPYISTYVGSVSNSF